MDLPELKDMEEVEDLHAHLDGMPPKKFEKKIGYCLELLERQRLLPQESTPERQRSLAFAAYVRVVVAQLMSYLPEPDWDAVRTHISKAVLDADESRHPGIRYRVRYALGRLLAWEGDPEGIPLLQSAVRFADSRYSYQLKDVMVGVAEHWIVQPENYCLALALFDWVAVADPAGLRTLVQKCTLMVASGHRADVQRIASADRGRTCLDIAQVVAARFALKRWTSIPGPAAEGVARAELANLPVWRAAFKEVLDRLPRRKEALPVDV